MAANSSELSPMEETVIVIIGFIIKMSSGVVYTIVMHSMIMSLYAWQIWRVLKNDMGMLMDVGGLAVFYLAFVVAEIALRLLCEEPLVGTKSGHVGHFFGSVYLTAYIDPLYPLFAFLAGSLVCVTFFVLLIIPDLISSNTRDRDASLTQPLV